MQFIHILYPLIIIVAIIIYMYYIQQKAIRKIKLRNKTLEIAIQNINKRLIALEAIFHVVPSRYSSALDEFYEKPPINFPNCDSTSSTVPQKNYKNSDNYSLDHNEDDELG